MSLMHPELEEGERKKKPSREEYWTVEDEASKHVHILQKERIKMKFL